MKKQLKYLIIAAIVLVVLVGGLLAVNLLSSQEEDTTEQTQTENETSTPLFGFETENITEIEVQNSKGSYTLTRDGDGNVLINGETELPMNSNTLSAAFSALAGLSSDKVVKEDLENSADYGLDSPASVTVRTASEEKTVKIGADSPTDEGAYCYVEGETQLLLSGSTVSYARDYAFENYISTSIMPALESTETNKLSHIKISGSGRSDVLEIVPKTEEELSGAGELTPFKMVQPIRAALNSDALSNSLKSPLLSLQPTVAAIARPTDEQKEQFGLNTPTFVLEYQIEGSQNKVIIGQQNSDGSYYMMKDGIDVVYLVDSSSISFMSLSYNTLLSSIMYIDYIDEMETVEYIRGDEHYIFNITGEDDAMQVSSNGKTVDAESFRTLYQNSIGLMLGGEASDPGTAEYAKIIYTKRDGTVNELSYHDIDGRRAFCALNGYGYGFVVTSDLDAVFESAAALLES